MRTYTNSIVKELLVSDFDRTYRGDTGCACGCGGNYYDIDDSQNQDEVNRRVKYVLRGIRDGKAEFFGNGVEVANPSYTRVTRIYFKDGIDYDMNRDGSIERTQEGVQVMDTLSQEQRSWSASTGLPDYHKINKTVYLYAEGQMSSDEYTEFYASWNPYEKDQADKLILEISKSVDAEILRTKKASA